MFGVLAFGLSVPFAIGSFFDEEQDIHLVHNLWPGSPVYGVILGVGLLAVAARPERTIAVFQGLALAAVGALIGGVMSGDLVEGAWFAPRRPRDDPGRAAPGAEGARPGRERSSPG